jgi:hypothetical protein
VTTIAIKIDSLPTFCGDCRFNRQAHCILFGQPLADGLRLPECKDAEVEDAE